LLDFAAILTFVLDVTGRVLLLLLLLLLLLQIGMLALYGLYREGME
jgi:uncharacterized protein (UPF0218 family)